MTWLPSEYLLKGIFLGLLLFAALSARDDPWAAETWFPRTILS